MAKILVVDDDPDFVLANGSEALETMRRQRPDLILLDVMMSTTLEGVTVSREIASDPDLKDVPIIMISSIATSEHAADFPDDERIPIAAWISKPIQPAVLLKTVRRFVD
jgi:CheY-like chemotaxis protein